MGRFEREKRMKSKVKFLVIIIASVFVFFLGYIRDESNLRAKGIKSEMLGFV